MCFPALFTFALGVFFTRMQLENRCFPTVEYFAVGNPFEFLLFSSIFGVACGCSSLVQRHFPTIVCRVICYSCRAKSLDCTAAPSSVSSFFFGIALVCLLQNSYSDFFFCRIFVYLDRMENHLSSNRFYGIFIKTKDFCQHFFHQTFEPSPGTNMTAQEQVWIFNSSSKFVGFVRSSFPSQIHHVEFVNV